MSPEPKSADKRPRGHILTKMALQILDQELRKWWDGSLDKQISTTKKLTRVDKATRLQLDVKTIDKIYRFEPVDAITLKTAFDAMDITPPFSIELHCVLPPAPSGNVPLAPTPCLGREGELTTIKALLESARIVTLTGSGGVGKTRLALEIGEEVRERFSAGVWFVELAGVTDPALILRQVASVLNIRELQRKPLMRALTDFIGAKPLLLIVDNCEHLLETCAMLAAHLLSSCPSVRILATSRERLNIRFEHLFDVPPLALPDRKTLAKDPENRANLLLAYASVRLFIERARVVRSNFTVTNENASTVAAICHRLDGIPLAIELAAARLRALSLGDLERGLHDCFRVLRLGDRSALPRHQTLQATMDWSYRLLSVEEQALLRWLSVFADGWGLEAAEKVGAESAEGEVVNLLASLVEKSLVMYGEKDGKGRYRLLEPVRQYAALKLGETEGHSVRDRHRDYFLTLAEQTEPHLSGTGQGAALRLLETEHANLNAALGWSLPPEGSDAGMRLCKALIGFWIPRDYFSEGREWCKRALATERGQERTRQRAALLAGIGRIAEVQCDYDAARTYCEENLALCREIGDKKAIANALNALGNVVSAYSYGAARRWYEEAHAAWLEIDDKKNIAVIRNNLGLVASFQGDYVKAGGLFEQCLTFFREFGPPSSVGSILANLGTIALNKGDYATARTLYQESLSIFRALGAQRAIAGLINHLGDVTVLEGDYDAARTQYDEALAIHRDLKNLAGIALSLKGLGDVALAQDAYGTARGLWAESLAIFQDLGDQREIASALEGFASLTAQEGAPERAAVLWGAAATFRVQIGSPLPPAKEPHYKRAVTEVQRALDKERFLAVWNQGVALTTEQAITYTMEGPGS